MLVLTRKSGEAISVGDDIKIVVVKIETGRVRIGIECPKDMVILREELKFDHGLQPERGGE